MKPLPPWHSSASATKAGARLQAQYFATGVQMRDSSASRRVRFGSVQRGGEAHRHPHQRLAFHREVGDHVAHDRQVDQAALERAAVGGVVDRLAERLAHQAGGADGEIQPRRRAPFR